MEKLSHKEYRDNLAQKLKGVGGHEERRGVLGEDSKSHEYREAKRAHKRERIINSPEYKEFIEEIYRQQTISDKLLIAYKKSEAESRHDTRYKIFDEISIYYHERITSEIIEELKATIKTPEQLDLFLVELLLKIHEYLSSVGISPDRHISDYVGHGFTKNIVIPIFERAFCGPEHSREDLDWWYTLGRRLDFSASIIDRMYFIYKDRADDPRSIKFIEYLKTQGIEPDERYWKFTSKK